MENNRQPQLVIGFIVYGQDSARYLPYFLASLRQQSWQDFKLIAVDNSEAENNDNASFLVNYPEIKLTWAGRNLGFAAAQNLMIRQAVEAGAKYFLALNPDMILETEAVAEMMAVIIADDNLATVSPKVLRWDFAQKAKTKIIDTCGIELRPGLRFVDLGQGQVDRGQFDQTEIFGPSGCAALFRLSALEKIKIKDQYFDERFFMYKEDCDLNYRLFLAGWKTRLAPSALVYHDRTGSSQGRSNLAIALNRRKKNRLVKQWSFLGQQLLFYKYWRQQNFFNKLMIIWWQLKILVFTLLFEPYLLAEIKKFQAIKKM